MVINNELASSPQYSCGCLCLECCDWLPLSSDDDGRNAAAAAAPGSFSNASDDSIGGQQARRSSQQYEWRCYDATLERPCSPYAQCKVRRSVGRLCAARTPPEQSLFQRTHPLSSASVL